MGDHPRRPSLGKHAVEIVLKKYFETPHDGNLRKPTIPGLTQPLNQQPRDLPLLPKQVAPKIVLRNLLRITQYDALHAHLRDHGQYSLQCQRPRQGQEQRYPRPEVVRVLQRHHRCHRHAKRSRGIAVGLRLLPLHAPLGDPCHGRRVGNPLVDYSGTDGIPRPDSEDPRGVDCAVVAGGDGGGWERPGDDIVRRIELGLVEEESIQL
mmetsp:Transcript_36192/g.71246  ORF Transcript_36192/g.71246 Transcript_36192/m.71246 type:complete len:208 (-) Transcript_36192:257-880(-)